MKTLTLAFFLVFGLGSMQEPTRLSQLVKEIMKDQLDYIYDETSNQPRKPPKFDQQQSPTRGLPPAHSLMPINPAPLVIVDGMPMKMEDLEAYFSNEVADINILEKENIKTAALYGTRGSVQGTIIITLKD